MIHPQQDAVVADPIAVKAPKVAGHVFQGDADGVRMLSKPFGSFDYAGGDGAVETTKIIIELGRRLYSIHSSCFRSARGRVWPAR